MRNHMPFLLAAWLFLFSEASAVAAEMTITAAASLANVFKEVTDNFGKKHPDLKIYVNYAPSIPLLKQILEGAPVDVFASADQKTMDKAAEARLIEPATRQTFAINNLVVIVPAGNPKPENLAGLKKLSRIAIGDPAYVPAGRYAEQALKKENLWNDLEKKFIPAGSVRQALEYVASGEADAGFVYGTDARQMGDRVETAFAVSLEKPVTYPIAVVTTGDNAAAGAEFIKYVLSGPAQKILNQYGFATPK